MMETQDEKILCPTDLGMRLSNWHSSMHDPVYAVSSSTLAKRSVPRELFQRALNNMERSRDAEKHEYRVEAAEICMAMESVLGQCSDLRKTVVAAIARYIWSEAWGTEMDERGTMPMSCELAEAAPETHPKALECAEQLLSELESENKMSIEEISAAEDFDPYELGGQLAGHIMFGCDDLKNTYETPYCEGFGEEFYGLFPEEEK